MTAQVEGLIKAGNFAEAQKLMLEEERAEQEKLNKKSAGITLVGVVCDLVGHSTAWGADEKETIKAALCSENAPVIPVDEPAGEG